MLERSLLVPFPNILQKWVDLVGVVRETFFFFQTCTYLLILIKIPLGTFAIVVWGWVVYKGIRKSTTRYYSLNLFSLLMSSRIFLFPNILLIWVE